MLNKSINHFVVKMLVISIVTTGANFYKVGAGCCFSQPASSKKEENTPLLTNNPDRRTTPNTETASAVEDLAKSAARHILRNISVAQAKITEGQFDAANTALKEAYSVIYRSLVLLASRPNVFEQVSSSVGSPYTSLASVQDELKRLSDIIKEQEQVERKKAMADKFYNDISSRIAGLNIAIDNLETARKQYEEINTLLNTQGGNVLEEEQVTNLRQQLEAVRAQLTKAQQERDAARIKAETERKTKLEEEARIRAEQERKAKLEEETRIKAEREKQAKISQVEQTIKQINSNIAQLETVVQEIEKEISTAQLGSTLDGSKNQTFETLKTDIIDQLSTLETQIANLPEESLEHYSDQMQSLVDRFETATSTYLTLTADDLADGLADDIDSALDNLDF